MVKKFDQVLNVSDDEIKAAVKKTDLGQITDYKKAQENRPDLLKLDQVWSFHRIQKRAKELLAKAENEIKVPEQIFANAVGKVREQIKENYLKRRKIYLEELAKGRIPYMSTDADGSCTFKTVQKTENTRSIGSLQDKYYLRMFLKAFQRIGAYFEVNTARPGFVPGPSLVGTEGPRFKNDNGDWINPRSLNEISSIMHEFGIHNLEDVEDRKLFKLLVINGLSGGVKHDPAASGLKIADETIKFGKFVDALNNIKLPDAPNGFLAKFEEILAGKEEGKPAKVFEYKSVPWIFIDNEDFTVKQYMEYTNLAKRAQKNSWSPQEFFDRLNEAHIGLPLDYYDPENPPVNEEALSRKIRTGMLCNLTPHAFDSDNIVRDDLIVKLYKVLADFCRSEEAQAWAEENYGIPRGTSLFTINGKDVAHVDFANFEKQYPGGLQELVDELRDKGNIPKTKPLINVIENMQPYREFTPSTDKSDVFDIESLRASNKFVIGCGDSPGSDASLLAQAIILGGAGFVVRGLMEPEDIGNKMVELFAADKNQWHEDSLVDLGEGQYRSNKTGKVKSKVEWTQIFLNKYNSKILRCNNIHENNAFNASVFSEFFAGDPEFDIKVDENQPWAQKVLDKMNKASLNTPISEAAEKALEGQEYDRPLLEKWPWLNKLPGMSRFLKIKAAGPFFDSLLHIVSKALMVAAPIELFGEITKSEGIKNAASLTQRIAYGVNTLASGVSRGLVLSAHRFPWQFIGEVFGFMSTFFPLDSTFGQTLRALANTNLIGRANELAMRSNYNLDGFAKDDETKAGVDQRYQGKDEKYKNKRQVAKELTKKRMDRVEYLKYAFLGGILSKIPMVGPLLAEATADLIQATSMAFEFVSHKALNSGFMKNYFSLGQEGLTKMSKNSGKPYAERHEEHTYAFTGILTAAVALGSTILGKLTGSKAIDTILTNAANIIPSLGIVTAGKLVHQDQAGDPRVFTDINKKQQNYSPERSGLWQVFGGWGQAIIGFFMHTSWGPVLYNMATGAYLEGIRQQLKGGIDDAAVNQLTRQGRYYVDPGKASRSDAMVMARPVRVAA